MTFMGAPVVHALMRENRLQTGYKAGTGSGLKFDQRSNTERENAVLLNEAGKSALGAVSCQKTRCRAPMPLSCKTGRKDGIEAIMATVATEGS